MKIDWMSLLVVAGVTIAAAAVVVGIYALGLAALTAGGPSAQPTTAQRSAAYACFGVAALVLVFGLWLIIPQFH
jgi:hypothetical protein